MRTGTFRVAKNNEEKIKDPKSSPLTIKVDCENENLPYNVTDVCRFCAQNKGLYEFKSIRRCKLDKVVIDLDKLIHPCHCLLPVHKKCLVMITLETQCAACPNCKMKYGFMYKKLGCWEKIKQMGMIKHWTLISLSYILMLIIFFYWNIQKYHSKYFFWIIFANCVMSLIVTVFTIFLICQIKFICSLKIPKTFDFVNNRNEIYYNQEFLLTPQKMKTKQNLEKISREDETASKETLTIIINFIKYILKIDIPDLIEIRYQSYLSHFSSNKFHKNIFDEIFTSNQKHAVAIEAKRQITFSKVSKNTDGNNNSVYYTSRATLNNAFLSNDNRNMTKAAISPKESEILSSPNKINLVSKYEIIPENKIDEISHDDIFTPKFDLKKDSYKNCTEFKNNLKEMKNRMVCKKQGDKNNNSILPQYSGNIFPEKLKIKLNFQTNVYEKPWGGGNLNFNFNTISPRSAVAHPMINFNAIRWDDNSRKFTIGDGVSSIFSTPHVSNKYISSSLSLLSELNQNILRKVKSRKTFLFPVEDEIAEAEEGNQKDQDKDRDRDRVSQIDCKPSERNLL